MGEEIAEILAHAQSSYALNVRDKQKPAKFLRIFVGNIFFFTFSKTFVFILFGHLYPADEQNIHRKKRFTSFPSPAGMSLTKLPMWQE
jgi:hypothetical protein